VRRLLYVVGRSAPRADDVKAIDERVREAPARHENSRFPGESRCVIGNATAVRPAHALRLKVESQQEPPAIQLLLGEDPEQMPGQGDRLATTLDRRVERDVLHDRRRRSRCRHWNGKTDHKPDERHSHKPLHLKPPPLK